MLKREVRKVTLHLGIQFFFWNLRKTNIYTALHKRSVLILKYEKKQHRVFYFN